MPLHRVYPDYGTPGNPNMDPYYLSPEEEAAAEREDYAHLADLLCAAVEDENERLREELDDLRADFANLHLEYDQLMQERGPWQVRAPREQLRVQRDCINPGAREAGWGVAFCECPQCVHARSVSRGQTTQGRGP